jgi:hypothetical protein
MCPKVFLVQELGVNVFHLLEVHLCQPLQRGYEQPVLLSRKANKMKINVLDASNITQR